MKRLVAVAVFSGAVVLSTHIIAPAEPPSSSAEVLPAALTAAAQDKPLVDLVDSQVQRLRERLAHPPAYPVPARDPFRFGAVEPPRVAGGPPAAEAAVPTMPASPVLPPLIAIATGAEGGSPVRTAILAVGDDVQIVQAGDAFGRFSIERIGEEDVELLESGTARRFRIVLH